MLWIAGADDGGVARRVRECITQNHLSGCHVIREELIEPGTGPDFIEEGPLDLRLGAALGNATTQDDTRTGGSGVVDQGVVFRREA